MRRGVRVGYFEHVGVMEAVLGLLEVLSCLRSARLLGGGSWGAG